MFQSKKPTSTVESVSRITARGSGLQSTINSSLASNEDASVLSFLFNVFSALEDLRSLGASGRARRGGINKLQKTKRMIIGLGLK